MALIVLDASVVIAYLDALDRHHQAAVRALEAQADDDLRLPATAYAEVAVQPARAGKLEAVRAELEALVLAIEPIGAEVAEASAALRTRHRALRLPDALVLATGETLGAEVVLTTDRAWRRFERVRVVG